MDKKKEAAKQWPVAQLLIGNYESFIFIYEIIVGWLVVSRFARNGVGGEFDPFTS